MTAIGDHTTFATSIDWISISTDWYVAYFMCFLYTSTYFRSGLVFMKGHFGAVPVGAPVLVRLNSLVKWRILWIWCTLKFTNFLNQISGQPWIKTQRRKFRQTEIFNLKLSELKFWWFLADGLYFRWSSISSKTQTWNSREFFCDRQNFIKMAVRSLPGIIWHLVCESKVEPMPYKTILNGPIWFLVNRETLVRKLRYW